MNIKGEFLFQSFEEALAFVNKPTAYEQKYGITISDKEIVINERDIKLVLIHKSDNTKTLVIFFKNSTKYDIWKFWLPSQIQALLLGSFGDYYAALDLINSTKRFT